MQAILQALLQKGGVIPELSSTLHSACSVCRNESDTQSLLMLEATEHRLKDRPWPLLNTHVRAVKSSWGQDRSVAALVSEAYLWASSTSGLLGTVAGPAGPAGPGGQFSVQVATTATIAASIIKPPTAHRATIAALYMKSATAWTNPPGNHR